MDLTNTRPLIISAGINNWYPKGIERLERSLNFVGSPIPWMLWKDYPAGSYRHEAVPYYFKIAAFEIARETGFTHVLWVDASLWAVRSPMQIFDIINEVGVFAFSSGYNLAQSVSDRALEAVDMTRDEAEKHTEFATGCVGFNFKNEDGNKVYDLWREYMDIGLSKGSRSHGSQSEDKRFLHHRQDQSCFSLALAKLKIRPTTGWDHIAYFSPNHNPEQVIFFIQGI